MLSRMPAVTDAAFRDQRAIVLRDQWRHRLERTIYELSKYVDTIARGDKAVIMAAGFMPSQSNGNRYGRAPRPTNLRIQTGKVGSARIKMRVDRWTGARMYQFEYRMKGMEEWQQVMSSKASCVIEGLEQFAEYEFRVSYLGRDPSLVYSEVVSSYVV